MSAPTSTRVTARLLPESDGHGGARRSPRLAQRLSRHLTTALMGLLLVMLAFTGFSGSSQPAQAVFGIPSMEDAAKMICNWTTDPPAARNSNSSSVMMGPNSVRGLERTAEEEFGTEGLFYSTYDLELGGCIGGMVQGALANMAMMGATSVTNMTTTMYTWATSEDLLSSFTEPLNCVVEGCNGNTGLKDALFLQYLTTMVVLGALWGAWNGLFKKRTMHTAQGVVWMLCAAIFGIFFLSNPGLIAEKSNSAIATFTDTVTNGVTGMSSSSLTKDDPCWLAKSVHDRGNRMARCSMWKAMSYQPWVVGQFGTNIRGEMRGAEATIGDRKVDDIRLAQLDAQAWSSGEDESDNTGLWTEVQEHLSDDSGRVAMGIWKGNDNNHRLATSTVALVASLCLGVLVMLISFSMVVMAVGMILLIMMAPIFLLVGIHPGFGRGIALKWLELLLGTMFKRIVLSAMLAILVSMYQVILSTNMGWFQQIALVLAVGIGAIVFRKPMLDTLNVVQLGGSSTGMEAGLQQQAKQASSGTVGAIAGGIAGGKIGGLDAMAKGAIKGGISGSRSGSMLRAASVGAGAGRRVGTRDKTADDREDRAEAAKTTKGATPSTKSGPKDTAKRQQAEHTEAQAQDAEWRNQQASLDEILAGAADDSGSGGTGIPRPDLPNGDGDVFLPDAQGSPQAQVTPAGPPVTTPAVGGAVAAGAAAMTGTSGAPAGTVAGMAAQQPAAPTAHQAGSIPRPVTATPMPTAPASPAGVPPVTLPSAPGMPSAGPADTSSAQPQRTLPTAPPVPNVSTREPNVSTREPNVSTREPNVSTREPNVSTGPTPVPHPIVPGSQPGTPDSQTGQGGRSSAPPRPQS